MKTGHLFGKFQLMYFHSIPTIALFVVIPGEPGNLLGAAHLQTTYENDQLICIMGFQRMGTKFSYLMRRVSHIRY